MIPLPPCAGRFPGEAGSAARTTTPKGQLMWLDVDTLIREKSGGKRNLWTISRGCFSASTTAVSWTGSTYVFEDVVKALNTVQPYDWATFLRARLDGHGPGAPLDGIARGGYKLVYTDTPSDYFKDSETRRKVTDLTYSLGMTVAPRKGVSATCYGRGLPIRAG
jgi:predicted metalloprotease with PDZ domain